jgi:16S rRNA (adenine1518-N6/adenine1519-N6)-dimethyltransferase
VTDARLTPSAGHRARKRFGQHFLHDPGVIARIVQAIDPRPGDALVEIGPGRGALTGALIGRAAHLDVVELDRDLAARLAASPWARQGLLRVHAADALGFEFAALAQERGQRLRVVGNLPYNVSTPLLFRVLEAAAAIADMHFMLQREVVARLGAAPGQAAYGRLGVMVQRRCRVEPLFTVGPGAFQPPPRVQSALVRLVPLSAPRGPPHDEARFAQLVRQAFSARRKTLRRALAGVVDAGGFARAAVDPGLRPEDLSVEDYARLAGASNPSGADSEGA